MRQPIPQRVFVVTVGDRVVASFMATNRNEVRELCREHWFLTELRSRTAGNGEPLWDGKVPLQARPAHSDEVLGYNTALAEAKLAGGHDPDEVFVSFQTG